MANDVVKSTAGALSNGVEKTASAIAVTGKDFASTMQAAAPNTPPRLAEDAPSSSSSKGALQLDTPTGADLKAAVASGAKEVQAAVNTAGDKASQLGASAAQQVDAAAKGVVPANGKLGEGTVKAGADSVQAQTAALGAEASKQVAAAEQAVSNAEAKVAQGTASVKAAAARTMDLAPSNGPPAAPTAGAPAPPPSAADVKATVAAAAGGSASGPPPSWFSTSEPSAVTYRLVNSVMEADHEAQAKLKALAAAEGAEKKKAAAAAAAAAAAEQAERAKAADTVAISAAPPSATPVVTGAAAMSPEVVAATAATATGPAASDLPVPDLIPVQGAPATASAPVAAGKAKPAAAAAAPAPPLKRVLSEAVKEIKEEGVKTVSGVSGLIHRLKTRAPINIHVDQVVQALFFGFLGFQLLLIKLIQPHPGWMIFFTLVGTLGGLAFSALFFLNKKKKAEACDVLGVNLGIKGLHHVLGGLPSWLSLTEREKMEWLNALLMEVWPFYDKGVCKMVKEVTADIFENALRTNKVPGIKKIGFKQLTFGDAPFRVESIYVAEHTKEAVIMEVDVRWCGDANITLAIELSAGEFTKMCPKVTDITFVGSLRVVLQPMCDTIPGFGAAMVTFRQRPRVKYNLDFGSALGGKYAAGVVQPFINWVVDTLVINSLVWPQRLVVPIINTDEMQLEVERMSYRAKGLLKVTVVKAADLPKADMMGSSDPLAELTTDGKYTPSTRCIKNKTNPEWEETFWLLVQEPHSQEMKVTVYDRDTFSAKELLTLNVAGTFGAKELLGRTLIRLKPITSQEGEPVTKWYHLGRGDFSNAEGCGKGFGRIQLTCLYRSFESFKPAELSTSEKGAVIIKLLRASALPRGGDPQRPMTIYMRVRCGEEVMLTAPVSSKANHEFRNVRNAVMEFHNVPYSADIKFKVLEKTLVADDEVAEMLMAVSDIVGSADVDPLSGQARQGFMFRSFKLGEGEAALYASLTYVPYF